MALEGAGAVSSDTIVRPQISDPEVSHDQPKEAHIVAREDSADADTIVLQAAVEGTPVTALCGAVFVPSRDPLKLPPCERCLDAVQDILKMRSEL